MGRTFACKIEFLFREKRSKIFKRNTVLYKSQIATVYFYRLHQGEIFLSFLWKPDNPFYGITGLQPVIADLSGRYVNIVGRGDIGEIRSTEESVIIRKDFQHTFYGHHSVKTVFLFSFSFFLVILVALMFLIFMLISVLRTVLVLVTAVLGLITVLLWIQIGRASCRESVLIWLVGGL